jgi:hypothetical protein
MLKIGKLSDRAILFGMARLIVLNPSPNKFLKYPVSLGKVYHITGQNLHV